MRIVYIDSRVIVCEKEAGELSEGMGESCLPALIREYLAQNGEERREVFLVHRLDRETKGVMVFARDSASAAALSSAIRDGSFKKEYLAVCIGSLEEKSATLTDLLFYDRRAGKSYVADKKRNGVKEAVLDYTVVGETERHSLLRIGLKTGRTHQIRVQLASRKHPLAGDRRYGAPKDVCSGVALLSCLLSFPHPESGETMTFSCEAEDKYPWNTFE